MLRGRSITTTYEYNDPDRPGRITGAVQSPAYTEWDHRFLVALQIYEAGLCPGCGFPKAEAWHPENDGWYEHGSSFTCNACTERNTAAPPDQSDKTVRYQGLIYTREPGRHDPLPPFPMPDDD